MAARKSMILLLLAMSLGAARRAPAARGPALGPVEVLTPTVRQHDQVVIALNPERVPSNPFNPAEVSLDALIATPSGQQITVPGFWFQAYRRSLQNPAARANDRVEVLESIGRPGWRVRFSSGQIGRHRFVIELRDAAGVRRSAEQSFQVDPGPNPGVVRISPRNRQYLEFESGQPFFPVGQNLCMYERKEGTYYYDRLLEKLHAAGGNYVRLWQEYYVRHDLEGRRRAPATGSFTGFPLETQAPGWAATISASAWRLDRVSRPLPAARRPLAGRVRDDRLVAAAHGVPLEAQPVQRRERRALRPAVRLLHQRGAPASWSAAGCATASPGGAGRTQPGRLGTVERGGQQRRLQLGRPAPPGTGRWAPT